jgi:hypothetical protein
MRGFVTFREVRSALRARLDEGNRGDRGWWLLTRVHLSPARLRSVASYLNDAGAANGLDLTRRHYADLGEIIGIGNANPAQTINRHYFLAMETPLRVLERTSGRSWDRIQLTLEGARLATEDSAVAVFERLLNEMRFCREPWYTAQRVAEYDEFDIRPYPATLQVMRENGGYIDIDDFDLFVSRIRSRDEIAAASASVGEFREFDEDEKAELRAEVRRRIPRGAGANPNKPYDNWRDMARHTFSLFSLGEKTYRVGNELFLSNTLIESETETREDRRREGRRTRGRRLHRFPTVLRIPETEAPDA